MRNYIKEGKIEASLVDSGYGKPTYRFHESELEKLPKPHRKREQREEVPKGENPTPMGAPIVEVTERVRTYRGPRQEVEALMKNLGQLPQTA